MINYKAPTRGLLFCRTGLAGLEQTAALPGFEDAGTDTAEAVPQECAKGNLVAGRQLGRARLVARGKLAAGDDTAFMRNKIATARFHAEHVLTRVPGPRDSVIAGVSAINELAVESFRVPLRVCPQSGPWAAPCAAAGRCPASTRQRYSGLNPIDFSTAPTRS